ncbi:hypothetical protein Pav013_3742 [Pseudomonas syringae pv. avellanae str. ISPaVe013]|nr:hypothetical protein Pav013_3742 [Pseudomonas syringae pv. avellanae str. ISPaVe013]
MYGFLTNDLAAVGVGHVAGVEQQVALGAQKACAVVEAGATDFHGILAADAFGSTGLQVVQRLAAGVDEQFAFGLNQACRVTQLAAAQVQGGTGVECAVAVVGQITVAVEVQCLTADHTTAVIQTLSCNSDVTLGFQASAIVVQSAIAHVDRKAGLHRTQHAIGVVELPGDDRHALGRRQRATNVVQLAELRLQLATGADRAFGIFQTCAVQLRGATGRQRTAAVVDQIARSNGQQAAVGGDDFATLVIQRTDVERHSARAADLSVLIVELLAGVDLHWLSTGLQNATTLVGQVGGVERDLLALGQAIINHRVSSLDRQTGVARDLACVAIQPVGLDIQRALACVLDSATAVINMAGAEPGIVSVGGDTTATVIEGPCSLDRGIGNAGLHQFATDVGQVACVQLQVVSVDGGAVGAQGFRRAGRECLAGIDLAAAEVGVAVVGGQGDIATLSLAAAEVQIIGLKIDVTRRQILALGRDSSGLYREVATATQFAVRSCARRQCRALGTANCLAGDSGVVLAGNRPAVVDIAGGDESKVALGVKRAAVINAGGIDAGRRCTADGPLVLQLAIGADHDFAGHRTDLPGIAHADA